LIAVILKYLIAHPGPPPDLVRPVLLPEIPLPSTPYGLPSGHTMRATFLAGTLLHRRPMIGGAVVLGIMVSLVYLGDHWTSEVLAGL
jgi:membrane-associated phospholipid phosphatase